VCIIQRPRRSFVRQRNRDIFWTIRLFVPTRFQSGTPTICSLIVAHPCLAPDRVWPTTSTLDRWDEATGENLIERITAAGDYQVAVETYRAVVKRWPKDKITLRNRARVLEWSWRD
jgi:hypothetical protein